ncbi:ABC transporter ATP-binding protein [Sporosarcina sp. ACRSL]|uniref:ABC transporter ATP-binding protein n=1 Tax=Sporosarcina sp. ACRSL TaxID=2918215 RepID=UPI001EF68937|nr:ABC transporter ATP-binding protein [Sporosarcina sp. ACRSL]MCG7343201.1 ABC transporter ATP-binding protein [Sporosarcina sp. ACRSL]
MAEIRLVNIVKKFDEDTVVNNLNLTIEDGSFTVIVGPSGCGKSTTLRMIAGLETPTSGEIWIGDDCVTNVEPGKRNIAMVFQNYALYPTMTVRKNIEFGLVNKKVPKAERESLIREISEIVGLTDHLDKKPHQLSGGQRQRVALARAMVKKPKVFILDEPLSNLDAKLRGQMRRELIQLHKRLGTTFVYVTHDQVEAMSMGDQIILLDKGVTQQMDSPMNMYHDPNNVFTAEFIGTPPMNILERGHLNTVLPTLFENVKYVGFKPEHAEIIGETEERRTDHVVLQSEILTTETLGAETIYTVSNVAGMMNVKSFDNPITESNNVQIAIPYEKLYFFDEQKERIRFLEIDRAVSQPKPAIVGGV